MRQVSGLQVVECKYCYNKWTVEIKDGQPRFCSQVREYRQSRDVDLYHGSGLYERLGVPVERYEVERERYPDRPVYDGARPSEPAAAMFAAMLYLKWTGAAVLPPKCDQTETLAITIGLDVMLRSKLLRPTVNAVFCRPLGEGRYAFSLWRPPAGKVTLFLSSDDLSAPVEPRALTFRPDTFWQRQTVAAPTGATLFWKIQPALPGQTTGARKTP